MDGEEEISAPFYKGIGVTFVCVDDSSPDVCDLCAFAAEHPSLKQPDDDAEASETSQDDGRWGVMYHIEQGKSCCQIADEESQHAFHLHCLRAFVLHHKSSFRDNPLCPVCSKLILPAVAAPTGQSLVAPSSTSAAPASDGDDELMTGEMKADEVLFAKKQKLQSKNYSVWVHLIQCTGLQLRAGSDKPMRPIASLDCFATTRKSASDTGKTYACVWNEAFSWQKSMTEPEFSRQTLSVRIEDNRFFRNALIGFIKFELSAVHAAPHHEFYQLWTNVLSIGSKKAEHQLGLQGKLQLSICVLSEDDMKLDPQLPLHVYDAEVAMWEEAQHKREITDFDLNSSYLQHTIERKQAEDAALTSSTFDIVRIRVYRAEDLPKLDSFGWVDAYVELDYGGLGDKRMKTKAMKNQSSPIWNEQFNIPIQTNSPILYNTFELKLKNENKLKDEWIGKCVFRISDILALPEGSPPIWKNLYQDFDGCAPRYTGRVLVEIDVERAASVAKFSSSPCAACRAELVPPLGSYRLDVSVLEGINLLNAHSEYQVDVTIGHTLTTNYDNEKEREKGGKCWNVIESSSKVKGANEKITPFLSKRSIMVHGLPIPRAGQLSSPVPVDTTSSATSSSSELVSPSTGLVDPDALPNDTLLSSFTQNTMLSDHLSMMPDLIIYVSKRKDREKCVGYLRIPLNSMTRPTENFQHGEDLTIFPHLWDAANNHARCLPLKPLIELYQLSTGFLVFSVLLTPVSGPEVSLVANQCIVHKLDPLPRQLYHFQAHVYQAKDLASVEASGLSSPLACVQVGDQCEKTKPQENTCFPLFMQTIEFRVELPVDLRYAPDISIVLYHSRPNFFRFNDPSIFMGRADVPATVASVDGSSPAWYPLLFEERQYGNICASFRLIPEQELIGKKLLSCQDMLNSWETYAVEISALALRGKLQHTLKAKKRVPKYQIECWKDVQSFTQEQVDAAGKLTMYIRRPSHPVFYSSLNVRIFDDNQLLGVTSISVDALLRTGLGWYRLIDLVKREFFSDDNSIAKRVLRRWRRYVKKRQFVDPRTIRDRPAPVVIHIPDANGSNQPKSTSTTSSDSAASSAASSSSSRFAYLDQPPADSASSGSATSAASAASINGDSVTVDIADESSMSSSTLPPDQQESEIERNMMKPRAVDADGNELIEDDRKQYLQCEQIDEKDAASPWDMQWRIQCEYESLPLTSSPFSTFPLHIGKEEAQQTFLEKLFTANKKKIVGELRGHFFVYRYGKKYESEKQQQVAAPRNTLFDAERYFHPRKYCVRVYILQALQLIVKRGRAQSCDPFVTVTVANECFKSKVKDSTLNPGFYECFECNNVELPAAQCDVLIQAYNDCTVFKPDLIGSTTINLENRVFSQVWQNASKPVERRSLLNESSGRLSQGKVEVLVEVLPMDQIEKKYYDFLLSPPQRIDWELRMIIWDCEKVTLKKIYQKDTDSCCYKLFAPPNQSDIQMAAWFAGSKERPQKTDVHQRSIDGTANFNWRMNFSVKLPQPEMLCNLKLQIWNINWKPDDCLAEAVVPLWRFFELARREYEKLSHAAKNKHEPITYVKEIKKQKVHLTHPQNSDSGDVFVSMQLMPTSVASTPSYCAATGLDAFEPSKNAAATLLSPPVRPDSSFSWWRLDKQICWRCTMCWRKIRWIVLIIFIILLAAIAGLIYAKHEGKI